MPIIIEEGEYTNRPYYSDSNDVKMLYGENNVIKWADLDGNCSNAFIMNRIAWANAQAYTYINARLRGGVYKIPFEDPYPLEIVELSARWAGVLLYESRGLADAAENTNHMLVTHKNRVIRELNEIRAGLLRIGATEIGSSIPQVVK